MRHCDEIANQEFLLGALAPEEAAGLEEHLRGCAACARQVDEYRALFAELPDLPLPAVPEGIADGVLKALRRRRLAPAQVAGRSLAVAFSGGLVGLLLALFRHPLFLFFGRLTHGFLIGGSAEFLRGLRVLLHDLLDMTVLLHALIGALTKVGPLTQQMGAAARSSMLDPTIVLSFALFLATALLIGRIVGHLGRENLGHAKH